MDRSSCSFIDELFARSLDRRAVLGLGARALYGLGSALSMGGAVGLLQSLSGCVRAPGTARDQFIFLSEEKEIAMGLSAFREVLRQAPLNENPEINEMVHRVGNRIAQLETCQRLFSVGAGSPAHCSGT